jgi:ribosome-binding factor A
MNKKIKKGKVEHLIRNSLSKQLLDFQHNGFISVMEVLLSDDFSTASVFISSFGLELKDIIDELNLHSGFFRKKIAKNLNLRYTPNLIFKQYVETVFDKTN